MRRVLVTVVGVAIWAGSFWACRQPSLEREEKSSRGFPLPDGDPVRGREAFVALRCSSCHEVAGLEDELPRPVATPETGVELGGLRVREPSDGGLVTSTANPPRH